MLPENKPKCYYSCMHETSDQLFPDDIYLFKIKNRNLRKKCEICSKVTMKTPKRCRSGVLNVNSGTYIVDFEQINTGYINNSTKKVQFTGLYKRFHLISINSFTLPSFTHLINSCSFVVRSPMINIVVIYHYLRM